MKREKESEGGRESGRNGGGEERHEDLVTIKDYIIRKVDQASYLTSH